MNIIEVDDMDKVWNDLIDRCNEYLQMMYPKGKVKHGSLQHRDLVLTFFAGVFETLLVTHQARNASFLLPYYKVMGTDDWLPDDRFSI